jgi:hypothetical protein
VLRPKGKQVDTIAHLKRNIVRANVEENRLAHTVLLVIARMENDPKYKAYGQGLKILPEARQLLETTGIDLSNGGWIAELENFQEHFRDKYKTAVFGGLKCDLIMFGLTAQGLPLSPYFNQFLKLKVLQSGFHL